MFKQGADLAEVRGVVGHEMGHYAHHHSLWMAERRACRPSSPSSWSTVCSRRSPPLGGDTIKGVGDPAGLPVLSVILAVLSLLGALDHQPDPSIAESDADHYSLEHFNEPVGLSKALVKTIEYRAAERRRGQLEEDQLFYDHPAVGNRIGNAVDWKAAHPKWGRGHAWALFMSLIRLTTGTNTPALCRIVRCAVRLR